MTMPFLMRGESALELGLKRYGANVIPPEETFDKMASIEVCVFDFNGRMTALEEQRVALESLRSELEKEGKLTMSLAMECDSVLRSVDTVKLCFQSMEQKKKYNIAMEELSGGMIVILMAVALAVIALIERMYHWLFKKKSGDASGGSSFRIKVDTDQIKENNERLAKMAANLEYRNKVLRELNEVIQETLKKPQSGQSFSSATKQAGQEHREHKQADHRPSNAPASKLHEAMAAFTGSQLDFLQEGPAARALQVYLQDFMQERPFEFIEQNSQRSNDWLMHCLQAANRIETGEETMKFLTEAKAQLRQHTWVGQFLDKEAIGDQMDAAIREANSREHTFDFSSVEHLLKTYQANLKKLNLQQFADQEEKWKASLEKLLKEAEERKAKLQKLKESEEKERAPNVPVLGVIKIYHEWVVQHGRQLSTLIRQIASASRYIHDLKELGPKIERLVEAALETLKTAHSDTQRSTTISADEIVEVQHEIRAITHEKKVA